MSETETCPDCGGKLRKISKYHYGCEECGKIVEVD